MTWFEIFQSTALLWCILFAAILLFHGKKARIVPAPTLGWVKKKVQQLFAEHLTQSHAQNIAELGCGWGGITMALARQYPDAHIDGYELSLFPYLVSKLRALRFGGRVHIYHHDFFNEDMAEYQGIFCYLSPQIMTELIPHLEKCAKGTVIVSNAFAIKDWPITKSYETHIGVTIPIYCYVR